MEKKFITFVQTEGNSRADEIMKQIIATSYTLASEPCKTYCKIIEDKTGNYFVINKCTDSNYKKFREVLSYLHPGLCEFDI